jgi:hypothetical protein
MAQILEEDIYTVAKRFFEQDYHDRGMLKWQGYHLSDHTEDVAKYTANDAQISAQKLNDKQSLEIIGSLLKTAYESNLELTIQLATQDDTGVTSSLVTGKILGYTDLNTVLVNNLEIQIDQINFVKVGT